MLMYLMFYDYILVYHVYYYYALCDDNDYHYII